MKGSFKTFLCGLIAFALIRGAIFYHSRAIDKSNSQRIREAMPHLYEQAKKKPPEERTETDRLLMHTYEQFGKNDQRGESNKEEAHKNKSFTSNYGHFTLDYPAYFEQLKINNAPHMLIKLGTNDSYSRFFSEDIVVTVSLWEYAFDKNITAWSDHFYNAALMTDKNMYNSPDDILCKKVRLYLNGKSVETLKSVVSINVQEQGKVFIKHVSYKIVHNGNYLQFNFYGTHRASFEDECAKVMIGLKLL